MPGADDDQHRPDDGDADAAARQPVHRSHAFAHGVLQALLRWRRRVPAHQAAGQVARLPADPFDRPVQHAVHAALQVADGGLHLRAHVAQADEARQEVEDDGDGARHRALNEVGGRADGTRRDGRDRVEDGLDQVHDLVDALDEELDGGVGLDDGLDDRAHRAEQGQQLLDARLHQALLDEALDGTQGRLSQVAEELADALAQRGDQAAVAHVADELQAALHGRHGRLADQRDEFLAHALPAQAQDLQHEPDDALQVPALGHLDAGARHRPGQPGDDAVAQVGEDAGHELAHAPAHCAEQVAQEAHRVLDDGHEGGAHPREDAQDAPAARAHRRFVDEFEQLHQRCAGEAHQVAHQGAELADDALDGLDRVQHVRQLQRSPGGGEGARHAAPREVARAGFLLEPGVGPLQRARLHKLIDLLGASGDELGEGPHHVHGGARHGGAGEGVAAQQHRDQAVARDLPTEVRQRGHEGLFQPGDGLGDEVADEACDAVDERREGGPRAPPHIARAEDVRPAQRVGEASEGVADGLEVQAQRGSLHADPIGHAGDDALALQHLEHELATRDQADEGAQDVDHVALDHAHVDGVATDDQRQQGVAGHVGGQLGQAVEDVRQAQAVHHVAACRAELLSGCGASGAEFAALNRRAGRFTLLDGVGEFVRDELATLCGVGRVLAGIEVDVAAGGEGFGAEAPRQLLGLAIGVDAHAREIGAESGLHEAAQRCRQGLAAATAGLDASRGGAIDRGVALAFALDERGPGSGCRCAREQARRSDARKRDASCG